MPARPKRASRRKPSGRGAQSGMAKRRSQRRRAGQPDSDRRWAEILAAGSAVFRRLGYAQATLADVALELGINRATLYYYVADKAELLVRILEAPVEQMTQALHAILDEDVPPEQKLRQEQSSVIDRFSYTAKTRQLFAQLLRLLYLTHTKQLKTALV